MMIDRNSIVMIEVGKDHQEETLEKVIDLVSTETQEAAIDREAMILANYLVEKTKWVGRKYNAEAVMMARKVVKKFASLRVGEKMI
jgi:hypothetical protein